MPSLDPVNKSRVRFHLGYATVDGIAEGDAARLEEAMDRVRDSKQLEYLHFILDECDRAFTDLMRNDIFDSRQLVAGDVNRSTVTSTPSDYRVWEEQYFKRTDHLARQLNVATYARPENARYRFQRLGSVSVFPTFGHPHGIADTTVASRLFMSSTYS